MMKVRGHIDHLQEMMISLSLSSMRLKDLVVGWTEIDSNHIIG